MLVLNNLTLNIINSIYNIQKNIHSTYINRITVFSILLTIIYTLYYPLLSGNWKRYKYI